MSKEFGTWPRRVSADDDVGNWDDKTPKSVTVTCPWCIVDAELQRNSLPVEMSRTRGPMAGYEKVRVSALYVCPRQTCGKPTLVFLEFGFDHHYPTDPAHPNAHVIGLLPRGRAKPMDGLPEDIADVRGEAWSCFYGGDHRASLVIGRAVVQRVVRRLGGEGRDLYHEIDDLHEKSLVTAQLREVAHRVRSMAREAAHPEDLGEVSSGEAKESLNFMDAFLEYTIALPERLRRLKEPEEQAT
jgi:hypothetical protein